MSTVDKSQDDNNISDLAAGVYRSLTRAVARFASR
jgi:hypothetical protein